jgi:hypothetical protein
MPQAGKGARGKAAGLSPPQHTETRSAISAPSQDQLPGCRPPDRAVLIGQHNRRLSRAAVRHEGEASLSHLRHNSRGP